MRVAQRKQDDSVARKKIEGMRQEDQRHKHIIIIELSRQETPNSVGGGKRNETSGGDDDDDDTQMRAHESRHIRAHMEAHIGNQTYASTQMKAHI